MSPPGQRSAADHLGEVADHLIGHFVDQARRAGASWTDIGRSLGVTKQAAQKRFVPKGPSASIALDSSQGFSRFTTRARNVVIAAQNEARAVGNDEIRPEPSSQVPDLIPYNSQAQKALELTFREALRLGHNYIGTEHILLALLELGTGRAYSQASASTRQRSRTTSPGALDRIATREHD